MQSSSRWSSLFVVCSTATQTCQHQWLSPTVCRHYRHMVQYRRSAIVPDNHLACNSPAQASWLENDARHGHITTDITACCHLSAVPYNRCTFVIAVDDVTHCGVQTMHLLPIAVVWHRRQYRQCLACVKHINYNNNNDCYYYLAAAAGDPWWSHSVDHPHRPLSSYGQRRDAVFGCSPSSEDADLLAVKQPAPDCIRRPCNARLMSSTKITAAETWRNAVRRRRHCGPRRLCANDDDDSYCCRVL